MKKEEPKILKRTVIPIQIVESSNITAAVNFHKPCGSAIQPATITTKFKKIKIGFRNESEKVDDIKRFREVKSYEISVNSKQFPHSRFSTDIPFDIKRKEQNEVYFGLKVEKQSGVLKFLDGYAQMGQKILERKGVGLTFNQKMKIQESMLDNRMRRELTQREAIEMLDDDADNYSR